MDRAPATEIPWQICFHVCFCWIACVSILFSECHRHCSRAHVQPAGKLYHARTTLFAVVWRPFDVTTSRSYMRYNSITYPINVISDGIRFVLYPHRFDASSAMWRRLMEICHQANVITRRTPWSLRSLFSHRKKNHFLSLSLGCTQSAANVKRSRLPEH